MGLFQHRSARYTTLAGSPSIGRARRYRVILLRELRIAEHAVGCACGVSRRRTPRRTAADRLCSAVVHVRFTANRRWVTRIDAGTVGFDLSNSRRGVHHTNLAGTAAETIETAECARSGDAASRQCPRVARSHTLLICRITDIMFQYFDMHACARTCARRVGVPAGTDKSVGCIPWTPTLTGHRTARFQSRRLGRRSFATSFVTKV